MVAGLELLILDQLVLLGQLVHTLVVLQLPLPLQVSSYPHGEQVSIKRNSIIYCYPWRGSASYPVAVDPEA